MTNTKDEGNPKLECRTTLRGALGGFVTRMGIGVLYLREGEAPSPAARMPACVQRSGRHLACRRAGHPARQNERVGALLESERRTPVPRGVVCPAVQYRAEQESGAPIWILIIGVSLVVCHSSLGIHLSPQSGRSSPTETHWEPRPAPLGDAWNSHCSP